jgi:predicted component of type VI protein secretion system
MHDLGSDLIGHLATLLLFDDPERQVQIAARIAEEISGREGYRAERARQASWLAARLGLRGS